MKTDRPLQAVNLPDNWHPGSWRERPALQMPTYPDPEELAQVQEELRALPPLVTSWEILSLKQQLAEAQEGKRFLLQGGDCAENFAECSSEIISNRLKVLLQMSLVLVHGLKLPVVRVGRFAGQYAKPRSADTEVRDGVALPSYRGDIVNGPAFTAEARKPDPRRMIKAHARSAMTMNFVRSLIDGGFADLHHPEYWGLGWVKQSPLAGEYQKMVAGIGDAVRFMETLAGIKVHNLSRVDFYTSHEALLLPYEEAQTRQVPRQWGWFNLSTHFPWIGMRTAALDGAHTEYFRGIRNPIAVKVGPSVTPDQLLRLIDVLNPDDEPGRLGLIHRMGASQVAEKLPPLLDAVKREGRRVLWICDAMHGNTESTSNGYKTRRFDNIRSEIEQSFDIHAAAGTRLGGVHLELTGEDVTECIGGARDLTEIDLSRAYRSTVDPRLNYEQALETAMLIVRKHAQLNPPVSA
ncbi:class II 3-deoxy-7-phosphoheptulonate synthase [Luteimonas wenzhouensis]|jgi:3-deoxy-7-phosphoheptulonate synthase|uniref:Phospho-2-dehydro-3-deoxyheptonate aldolase n=1 Tax=Luteimonas wenzhouensis TaxID=2599615 RepID=A0A5C5U7I1_9GAMM|nr:3-deoxy-7-phosphoheptulonate synthase class II [Luteimonas wenzhouensis]NLW97635.1 3-deoxy-7-phosphoheptulonate synthase class II [Xanthomonadaceae bacterium]TWT21877.1 3-deoxy-7-phosphoheptulonate synthase class II [Luteimonas wenzhouensis]